jgi:hypothetical protein
VIFSDLQVIFKIEQREQRDIEQAAVQQPEQRLLALPRSRTRP